MSGKRGVVQSIVLFTVAQALLIALVAFVLMRFVWTDAASAHAIQASAWLAVVVQVITFAIGRLVAQQNVIAGWGVGALMRFAVLAFWAFLGVSAFGLAQTPALYSLVIFFFVSTLIEPVFLNI